MADIGASSSDISPDYLGRARELEEAGDIPAAVEVLRHGLRAATREWRPHSQTAQTIHAQLSMALAELLARTGDVDGAMRIMIDLRTRSREAGLTGIELLTLANIISVHRQLGDLVTATRYAEELAQLWPSANYLQIEGSEAPSAEDLSDLLLSVARAAYYDLEDYERTATLAGIAAGLAAASRPAWWLLAFAHLRLERLAESVEAFDRAIALDPDHPGQHTGRANALEGLGRVDEAIGAIDEAIALSPEDPKPLWTRAGIHERAGHLEQALADLDSTIAMASQAADRSLDNGREFRSVAEYRRDLPARDIADIASLHRLQVLRRLGRADEAIRDASALAAQGDEATRGAASCFLGEWHLERQEPELAERAFTAALDVSVEVAAARLGRARSRIALGQIDAALIDLDALSGMGSDQDPAGAAAVLTELLERNTDLARARRVLGHALLGARKPAMAIAELDRVLADQPADWECLLWRGLALLTHSDSGEADEDRIWNEGLTLQRVLEALANFVAAAQAAPDQRPLAELRWLFERAAFFEEILSFLLAGIGPGEALTGVIPALGPILTRIRRSDSMISARDWAGAAVELTAARQDVGSLHMPLLGALIDILLADVLLRLYEVQRALDHLAAAETMLPWLGDLPGGIDDLTNGTRRYRDAVSDMENTGRRVLSIDFDHLEFSVAVTSRVARWHGTLRAEAMARIGEPELALSILHDLDGLLDDAVSGYRRREALAAIPLLRDSGQYDRALALIRAVQPHVSDRDERLRLLIHEATTYMKMDDLRQAEKLLEGALGQAQPVEREQAMILAANLASVLQRRGAHRRALDLLDANPPAPAEGISLRANWHVARGRAQQELGSPASAEREFVTALDLFDRVRGKLREEDARISWQTDRLTVLDEAVDAALNAGDVEAALELTERGRARALVDQLELGYPQVTPEAVDLAAAVAKAQDRRRLLLRLARVFSPTGQGDPPGGELEALRELAAQGIDLGRGETGVTAEQVSRELAAESDALRRLEAQLHAVSLGERESIAGTVVSTADIRSMLTPEPDGPRVLLAEYFTLGERVVLFLLGAGASEVQANVIGFSEQDLLAYAGRWLDNVAQGRRPDLDDLNKLAALVEPILSACEPGDLVWFVPHGLLHYVPLHAVRVSGKTLIERNPVCYAPSASVVAQCRQRRAGRSASAWRRALVIGDSREDLTHARDEARAVAELFGATPYLAGAATKAVLTRLRQARPAGPEVIHLACHGVFDSERPLESGILLATEPGGREEDTILTAEEVYGLRLEAGLVTLSACQSGVNERRPGEELIGLTRAFLYAGAAAVVVSLWSVDDLSTGLLMEDFYRRLRGNARPRTRPVDALRDAQIHLMGITAGGAIERLNQRLMRATDPTERAQLRLDMARLYVMAGDLRAAIGVHDELSQELAGMPGSLTALAERRRRLIQFKSEVPVDADYEVHPFEHPYFWAGFVLVGDWR
jgi:CHAT domain-containing protein/tetratricopeptide (TPR) repeat protein